jgi:hypothetical protein
MTSQRFTEAIPNRWAHYVGETIRGLASISGLPSYDVISVLRDVKVTDKSRAVAEAMFLPSAEILMQIDPLDPTVRTVAEKALIRCAFRRLQNMGRS